MELHKDYCVVPSLICKTMIDLEKQKEPSEEEIQEWVNEVYEYAVNLYTNHNMSWGEVRQELINQ